MGGGVGEEERRRISTPCVFLCVCVCVWEVGGLDKETINVSLPNRSIPFWTC